jgi:HEAT repeats
MILKKRNTPPAQNTKKNIQMWINDLGSPTGSERLKARSSLIREEVNAVPGLIQALSKGSQHVRWEAAKILAQTKDPTAASALVHALEDEDHDVRWAAMKALIALDRVGLEPLLQALMKDFDSVWLLEGAHHILHILKNKGRLGKPLLTVFRALEDVEPEVTVPWAAKAAWESLFGPKGSDGFE